MGLVYLLDTHILSEPTKKIPNKGVLQKLQEYNGQYAIAVMVWHELHFGVAQIPKGKRKALLQQYLYTLENHQLVILPYEQKAAEWLAQERWRLTSIGKTPAKEDSEIAAVAKVNRLILVTRHTADFKLFEGLLIENWFSP